MSRVALPFLDDLRQEAYTAKEGGDGHYTKAFDADASRLEIA